MKLDVDNLIGDAVAWSNNLLRAFGKPPGSGNTEVVLTALEEYLHRSHKNIVVTKLGDAFSFILDLNSVIKKLRLQVESLSEKVIENQDSIIKLQQDLLSCKTEQFSSVKDAVKTTVEQSVKSEFKTYSSVTAQGLQQPVFSQQEIKKVVRTVVEEDDRSRNLIMFGLAEEQGENLESVVGDVMLQLGEKPNIEVVRLGNMVKTGDARNARPVKLSFTNSATAGGVVRKAKDLKGSEKFGGVFIRPDRSPEQRVAQRKLVSELKSKLKDEPNQRHYIRGGKVFSVAPE